MALKFFLLFYFVSELSLHGTLDGSHDDLCGNLHNINGLVDFKQCCTTSVEYSLENRQPKSRLKSTSSNLLRRFVLQFQTASNCLCQRQRRFHCCWFQTRKLASLDRINLTACQDPTPHTASCGSIQFLQLFHYPYGRVLLFLSIVGWHQNFIRSLPTGVFMSEKHVRSKKSISNSHHRVYCWLSINTWFNIASLIPVIHTTHMKLFLWHVLNDYILYRHSCHY